MVSKQNFFKERSLKEIKDTDYIELVKCLTTERAVPEQVMLSVSDKNDSFYFILRGEVNIICKNTLIKDWNGKDKKYKQLKDWKKKFDDKALQIKLRLI
jgi:hypothetical protein